MLNQCIWLRHKCTSFEEPASRLHWQFGCTIRLASINLAKPRIGDAKEETAVLWITYCFFSLASLSCVQMTLAFSGVIANRGLSRGVFNASAIMSVVYTLLTVASGQLVR